MSSENDEKFNLLVMVLSARLGRQVTEEEITKYLYGSSEERTAIWDSGEEINTVVINQAYGTTEEEVAIWTTEKPNDIRLVDAVSKHPDEVSVSEFKNLVIDGHWE